MTEETRGHAESEERRKQAEAYISQVKSNLEEWSSKEQELQATRIERETQLRIEQGKIEPLEQELDRPENSLED